MMHGGIFYNSFGSLVVALGHVGMMMLVVQSGAITWLTNRLAAVGRMALTNYLTHSIVCTTLFYGYGFGLFGTINRTGLAAIVLIIWVTQLLISPIWLRHFRFGPAEWLWRSLTYWKLQPMSWHTPVPDRESSLIDEFSTCSCPVAERFSIRRRESQPTLIRLDPDPLVYAVDSFQIVRCDSQGQESVDVRGDAK